MNVISGCNFGGAGQGGGGACAKTARRWRGSSEIKDGDGAVAERLFGCPVDLWRVSAVNQSIIQTISSFILCDGCFHHIINTAALY